ncbi:tRNA-dependent cyclodipeptide synthase [Flavobacterium sp.]|uniref:tRNA-dependent cyclodipeptide synthase n=1 Tax=Flavobacterium sp. TaxID=239 RepID=UPI002607508B|nr:tRNA-dependent cyclodipeptide synthase [Flavobacterium sp.]MDD2987140.1 tRNA-dependent cyclodipeptide synthase [Flavobacterium sp.]
MNYKIKKLNLYPKLDYNWNHHVFLGMSMNNKVFQSPETLVEIINLLALKSEACLILVGDYLHRYNEQIFNGISQEDAIKKCQSKGAELKSIFNKTIKENKLKFNYSYRDTESFLSHPNFKSKMQRFEKLYLINTKFKELIEYTVDVFLRRQSEIKIDSIKARELCVKYLLEEMVIFEILAEEGYIINVYPGNQLPIIKSICTGELKEISQELEKIQAVEIKFRPK